MKTKTFILGLALLVGIAFTAQAAEIVIEMHAVTAEGIGPKIGTITASSTPYGTLFTPDLKGLSPGLHGFHLHAIGNCGPKEKDGRMVPGLAAGGHYDPGKTGAHRGPYAKGHLGDLPALYVDQSGMAVHPVLAPRVRLKDLKGRSLVIHAGGDNYSDKPVALGGGGARVVCGVISK
jgi:Cu-Zn family superoxide dismutase